MSGPAPGELQRSSRDAEKLRDGLRRSLAAHLPGTDHEVRSVRGTSATGMSSETLIFEATWTEGRVRRREGLVARVAPSAEDAPVFPSYDMPGQFATIETVARLTEVPVPPPRWCDPGSELIGSPFFVMGEVVGEVPPDVMPYNFGGNWLFDADPADQRRVQESTVEILARLHNVERPGEHFPHLGGGSLRSHVSSRWDWYRFAARDVGRSELVEKGFAWLESHWPAHESTAVFCWGDARIGNVMYRNFEPAAVLDWEMASIAPPETDLAWLSYLHRMFEEMAAQFGFPGMPGFLLQDDVAATYERLSGRTPRDLGWYTVYAAVQLGIVYLRTGYRQVRFGERQAPASADELLLNGAGLAELIGS
ncbi:MAG TPA: phosphotransferase family protein [Acidimicrobiales bacterium]|nr:phosphotransferase family protein [Acidimicrobiales bacterium]